MGDCGLFGHQNNVALTSHRCGERLVFFRIVRCAEKRIQHDQRAAVIRQSVQQLRVPRTIPWLFTRLVELIERGIVHQDERDLVGCVMIAETKQIIEARVHPEITQRHDPQNQTTKHRLRRSPCGSDA